MPYSRGAGRGEGRKPIDEAVCVKAVFGEREHDGATRVGFGAVAPGRYFAFVFAVPALGLSYTPTESPPQTQTNDKIFPQRSTEFRWRF